VVELITAHFLHRFTYRCAIQLSVRSLGLRVASCANLGIISREIIGACIQVDGAVVPYEIVGGRGGGRLRRVARLAPPPENTYFIHDLFSSRARGRNGNERRRMFTLDELYGPSSPRWCCVSTRSSRGNDGAGERCP